MTRALRVNVNGQVHDLAVDPQRMLLWVLRTDLGLTGTKYGCGEAHCGACAVLVDGVAMRSCRLAVGKVEGKEVTTIEGLAPADGLHPLQQAFIDHDALQCGYCIPGMIVTAASLLKKNANPTEDDIVRGMDHNFCRCGAHVRIVKAIEQAAAQMRAPEGGGR